MKLRKGAFEDFANQVEIDEKQIIVYGAGMNGQTLTVYWLNQCHLSEKVVCYVDSDTRKHGKTIQLGKNNVPIRDPSVLEKAKNCVLLMTVNDFEPIIKALEQVQGLEDMEVYFLPIMIINSNKPSGNGAIRISEEPLIPRKINYCWFSGNPIPDQLQKCIDSWKRFCPSYEIIRWDERNYDVSSNEYMRQAYSCKRWGFVPDVARLDILYRYGGIYLDTDVELTRNLDELLYQPAFCSVERWGTVNMGGCSGAQPGNPVIKAMLDYRKDEPFLLEDGSLNLMSCGYYETPPLIAKGLRINNQTQVIANGMMTVYSSDFFHPYEYISGRLECTKNTFSIHHFDGGWMDQGTKLQREKEHTRLSALVKNLHEGP